jgi:ribose/xylose/arabinose/galactoside ABC-type transport system permease subunit
MNIVSKYFKEYAVIIFLIALVALMGILEPHAFLSFANLMNILDQVSVVGILTVGILFVMLAAGIDLSVGGMMAFSGVLVARFVVSAGLPYPAAIALVLVICVGVGMLQGYIIVSTGIFPMIGTLAMMGILSGAAYVVSQGSYLTFPKGVTVTFLGQGRVGPENFPIPFSVIMLVVVLIVAAFILGKTYFGRYFYLVGSNLEAARVSGINTKAIQIISYGISALLAGFGGIIYMSRMASGSAQISADGWEMECLTAAVIGGVSLMGGEGKVIKAFAGVLIMGVLTTSMIMLGIDAYWQKIITGIVFLAAVCFDGIQKNIANNARTKIAPPKREAEGAAL